FVHTSSHKASFACFARQHARAEFDGQQRIRGVWHFSAKLRSMRRVIGFLFVRALAFFSILLASTAFAEGKDAAPEILFTFDDGPALDKTPKVLDILDQHHIKAVFFVNGWHFQGDKPPAEKSRALLREVQKRGHAIGNHTIHHYFLCGKVYSKRAVEEIEGNATLIEQAIGV